MVEWAKGLEINVSSMVNVSKYAIPVMMRNDNSRGYRGSIINMGSVAGSVSNIIDSFKAHFLLVYVVGRKSFQKRGTSILVLEMRFRVRPFQVYQLTFIEAPSLVPDQ